ncbi:hypothetical protein ANOM_003682 [Aspergillus nomiae NRRL 13137]|uniref:NAD(P)-binding domain-containing protein n=1 Tax=Aspergillus nomiae NRRL (strain ATCC 15546 / NRRL 13137 / CBS 260.88 / M93) TaxID=1509407 RepID=A0A0L1JAP1_ASPN3|nr:uncharacterized protein ANOM_003682 [Aspergillus nomiae NRRL 13137]KNG88861.1 hypothetical protein ANOM_003682 [Aspergillus nomiae NRRL 13137]
MVNVAIAGGTGDVGRTILEVLQASTKHEAFVLSRKSSTVVPNTLVADYNDIDQLVSLLEDNKIHTVICALSVEGSSLETAQLNLIKAAARSQATKRFVANGFAIPYPQEALEVLPQLKVYFDGLEALRHSGLEWTVFHIGMFMDYFATPALKSYLKPHVAAFDLENKVAAIPGDGNVPVTLTYSFDMARFVVASLDLEHWEEESRVVGDEITWNEFLALAEDARGSKFEVHYDDIEKLKRFEITELPAHKALYDRFPKEAFQWFTSIFERFTAEGQSHLPKVGSLNERFPDIKPLSVQEMLNTYWKSR